MKRTMGILTALMIAVVVAACSGVQIGSNPVPPGQPGNSANDPASAARYLPNLSALGYTQTDAANISQAITQVGGSASLITGNPVTAAMIQQIDSTIQCYRNVGAVAANVYTQADIASVLQGQVPRLGVLAVVNQDRVVNNFFNCVGGGAQGFQSQAAVQPCAGTGTFSANGETLHYLYAATDPALCSVFVSAMPAS